jgi:hypothetical protein
MQDRPDLIQSELAGLAFDAQQSIFRPEDIETMFTQAPYPHMPSEDIFLVIDPAAGGPQSDYAFVSFTRLRGVVRIIGAEILSGCKEPEKQFDLVADHIRRLRAGPHEWCNSRVIIYVERNLGHEAEHHRHALKNLPGVFFREDAKKGRVGLLTTNDIKHGMSTLLNIMLRENRVCMLKEEDLVCRNAHDFVLRLREQLNVYSYQFKDPSDTFGKQRVALTGKVGGMKDDIVIALQLGVYFTVFQPSTLHPQPSTLNPQPSTLNPQPSTRTGTPSTGSRCMARVGIFEPSTETKSDFIELIIIFPRSRRFHHVLERPFHHILPFQNGMYHCPVQSVSTFHDILHP